VREAGSRTVIRSRARREKLALFARVHRLTRLLDTSTASAHARIVTQAYPLPAQFTGPARALVVSGLALVGRV
jgi:hypothetical protein